MITFWGITWHWYGLVLALSILLAWELIKRKAKQHLIDTSFLERQVAWIIAGGVVGARLYHVVTDWPLYQAQPWAALYIWRGGLSVIGAVLGGMVVLAVSLWRKRRAAEVPLYLDLAVFGVPFAQALGRWGNYFNQELYGPPTKLPWSIWITAAKRLPGYEAYATYHPLFAYEMVAMVVFGLVLWLVDARRKISLGSGRLFAVYVGYYAILRFILEFGRLDARRFGALTINQGVMILLLIGTLFWLFKRWKIQHAT